jgi:hypothetical protein
MSPAATVRGQRTADSQVTDVRSAAQAQMSNLRFDNESVSEEEERQVMFKSVRARVCASSRSI